MKYAGSRVKVEVRGSNEWMPSMWALVRIEKQCVHVNFSVWCEPVICVLVYVCTVSIWVCIFTAVGAVLFWPGRVRLCHTCSRAEPAAHESSSANLTVFLPRHFPAECQLCYLSICVCEQEHVLYVCNMRCYIGIKLIKKDLKNCDPGLISLEWQTHP